MTEPAQPSNRATVAIYDRPPWWRTRRAWRIAIPVVASIASLVGLYLFFA